jgi:hypothetical protein
LTAAGVEAAEAAKAVEAAEASAPEYLDAGNADQGCHRAGRRAVADESRTATLSDVTRTVDGEGRWDSQEAAACEDREASLHRLACAGQVVRSRSEKDGEQGGIHLGLVTAEAGRDHKHCMLDAALGSRWVCDGMWAGIRGVVVAGA